MSSRYAFPIIISLLVSGFGTDPRCERREKR
jgi:hypothetical protein